MLSEPEAPYVARAFDKYLRVSELQEIVPDALSTSDSIAFLENYVNNWIEQAIILKKAELNMPDLDKKLRKEVENYRDSRAVFLYKNEFIMQKLDTVLNESEFQAYYDENKYNFELKDYILRFIYLKLDIGSPDLDKIKKQVDNLDEENILDLEEYCIKYSSTYHLEEDEWVYLKDLKEKVPLQVTNPERFFKKNKYIEIPDSNDVHLLKIIEFKLKDGISPLALEKSKIKKILLNLRRKQLLSKMRKDIYEDAYSHGNIEIFLKNE